VEHGIEVDHSTVHRWVLKLVPLFVSARIVWTRFWDSGGLFKHPCLTCFEG
jgi:hypothetical protein